MSNNDLTGQRIGRYEVRGPIGQGGMAEVYLAFDAELERNVALKLMLPGMTQDQKFVDRFRREARTAARLNHPHIVQVYDVGAAPDGRPYIAMQYVDGGSLRAVLTDLAERGKLLPTDQALAIVRQVADALAVAHRAGIVHRDLKPSNILIRADGTPVVVDLGIAAVQGGPRLTQTGNLIGTPHYMSPEQVKGEPIDGRSDLYSLGVILYELLAGVRPFAAAESIAVLHAHVYEPPPPLDGLRADLTPQTVQIVHTLLRKSPDERYATAEQLMAAIDQALLAEGSSAQAARTTVVLTQISDSDLISRQVVHLPEGPTTPPAASRQPPPPPVYTPPVAPPPQRSGPSWVLIGALALIALLAVVIVVLLLQVLGPDDNPAVAAGVPTSSPAIVTVEVTSAPDPAATDTEPENTPLPTPTLEAPAATNPPPPTDPPPTDTPEPSPTPMPDLGPELIQIARSVEGVPINAVRFGDGANSLVMVGGINAGFAPSGVSLAQRAIDYYSDNLDAIPANITLYVVDSLNPDATYDPGNLPGRFNANGVDLNRNWDCDWSPDPGILGRNISGGGGTRPLSEPETRGLHDFIMEVNPVAVVFWTARATNGWSSPGFCGTRTASSGELAAVYGFAAGYDIVDYEGETDTTLNGDATNYLDQVGIAAISVLLPSYTDPDWPSNREAITAVMDFYNNR